MPDNDLEIGLRWDRERDALYVALRAGVVAGNVDRLRVVQEPLRVDIDELADLMANEPAYGEALTRMVLRPVAVREFYEETLAAAGGNTLHVRLHLTAPARYHALRWESLRDPKTGMRIATQSRLLFSRYLSGEDWRVIPALPEHDRNALIVVAAPHGLKDYRPNGRELGEVNVEDELARAREALRGKIPFVHELEGAATLPNVLKALEQGVDVLYLVCHGALREGIPHLYLERPDRSVHAVDGRDLVEGLLALEHRPTVAMLCSCQSMSASTEMWSTDGGELAALGPRLAAAGVPAVVGMQGNISMATARVFVPAFFAGLGEHGVVDEAMSAARRSVGDRPDWWVPVLFSRLRSGRTYYRSGFSSARASIWPALELQIPRGQFTPVIGPLLARGILGSRQEVARRWVRKLQLPIAPHAQGDLAQVAQYELKTQAAGTVLLHLQQHFMDEMRDRRRRADKHDPVWGQLSGDLLKGDDPLPAIGEVGSRLRLTDQNDPYRILASLKTNVYVTTGWTDLLEDALRSNNRRPIKMVFPWRDPRKVRAKPPSPTVECPLVYHLYGHLEQLDSLVLTEDDYFAWQAAWSKAVPNLVVPSLVSAALTTKSLLLLGYRLDDWDFRVLFQGIKLYLTSGSKALEWNQHVAVQLDRESGVIEPDAVEQYLERYFGKDNVFIYWGEPRQFLTEIRERFLDGRGAA